MITQRNNHIVPKRGFTLLIAIILASVALVIGLALADVAYKQVVLSSTARNSQIAFYRADSAMECALYWDQKFAAFNAGSSFDESAMECEGRDVVGYTQTTSGGRTRTTFEVSCVGGGRSGSVTVIKESSGECATGKKSCIYANGFNVCDAADPNRFERGLKVTY